MNSIEIIKELNFKAIRSSGAGGQHVNKVSSKIELTFDVILPAYTHLQRAQPVLAPHYWLAYCEKYQRDRDRIADARKRTNVSGPDDLDETGDFQGQE